MMQERWTKLMLAGAAGLSIGAAPTALGASVPRTSPTVAQSHAVTEEQSAAQPSVKALDPTLIRLSKFIGGTWVGLLKTPHGELLTEVRCEWALGGRAIRARGVIGKGSPDPTETESLFGWDPVNRSVYHIDFHGDHDVLKGTVKSHGTGVEYQFKRIVGPPGHWRATCEMPARDTMIFTLFAPKEGRWVKRFSVEYRRQ